MGYKEIEDVPVEQVLGLAQLSYNAERDEYTMSREDKKIILDALNIFFS